MRRRALLGAIATTAVAGCTSSTGDGPTDSSPENGSESTPTDPQTAETTGRQMQPPDEEPRRIEAAAADRVFTIIGPIAGDDDRDLTTATWFASPLGTERPTLVEATLTNTSEFERVLSPDEFPPFAGLEHTRPEGYADVQPGGPRHRYLVPTDAHEFVKSPPEFDRDRDGIWRLADSPQLAVPDHVRLEPSESIRGQWAFVSSADDAGKPISPGTYEFGWDGGMTIRVWSANSPGPTGQSVHEGRDLPPLPREKETAWYHESSPETPVYLHPSQEAGRLPMRLEFTLVNHSRENLSGNPYDWALYKYHDGEWFRIAPFGRPEPMRVLFPGRTHGQSIKAFNRHGFDGDTLVEPVVEHLGPGLYAFRSGIEDAERVFAALLEFEGEPVAVTPKPGLATERDGAIVRAVDPAVEANPEQQRTLVTVERIEAVETDERLLPEQLMGSGRSVLRNAIGLLDPGVETVELEVPSTSVATDYRDEEALLTFVSQTGPQPLRATATEIDD